MAQHGRQSIMKFSQALLDKGLSFVQVYDEYLMKGILFEGLRDSLTQYEESFGKSKVVFVI